MLIFNDIMDCLKMEMILSRKAKLFEMETATKKLMDDFLTINFKTADLHLLSKLHSRHVLCLQIIYQLATTW